MIYDDKKTKDTKAKSKTKQKSLSDKSKKIIFSVVGLVLILAVVAVPLAFSTASAVRFNTLLGRVVDHASTSKVVTASAITTANYSSEKISWGVNPNTREQTPEPPANGAALLEKYGGKFVLDTKEKEVLFTFDLGYEAGYTEAVLDILAKHNIKGIFFLCGNYLKEEAIINRMLREGHLIGNHTDRHKDLPTLSSDLIAKDITDFDAKYKAEFVDAAPLVYFRPPKGNFCERTLVEIQKQNLTNMMWSIAIVDWGKDPIDGQKSADKITSRLHPGAIILLHITNSGTVDMLEQLIPQMHDRGYVAASPI